MKIILANPRGFCAGVNMAIESLELALELFGPPIYVYHEIVHNKYVVERFTRPRRRLRRALDEVPDGATLLYSAHGVSPADPRPGPRARRLQAIDATCPLVTKVHLEAIRYAREGYTIVLIGHEGHDEVIGTMGEAPEAIVLVETAEDVERLEVPDPSEGRLPDADDAERRRRQRRHRRAREKFPQIVSPPKDDICYATQNRQEAVRELAAARPTLVLVLGSQNSSNSQRLAEIASSMGVPAHLIDGVAEIRPDWFEGVDTVLITAGRRRPRTWSRSASSTSRATSARRSERRTSAKSTSTSRCRSRFASCSRRGPPCSAHRTGRSEGRRLLPSPRGRQPCGEWRNGDFRTYVRTFPTPLGERFSRVP